MRRSKSLLCLAALGLFALVGVAAATNPHPSTQDVSATFSANQVRAHTHTCSDGVGNTFRVTDAVWHGTSSSSEPRLSGNLVIATHAVLNETTGDGWLRGTWRTRATAPANPRPNPRSNAKSNANLQAVIDNGNHIDGLANGEARGPYARLLGNWSATIVGTTLAGEIGAIAPVAPDNSALLYRGGC